MTSPTAKLYSTKGVEGWYERTEPTYRWLSGEDQEVVALSDVGKLSEWITGESADGYRREFRERLLEQLRRACDLASRENWDGYGGLAVTDEVCRRARDFIRVLPPAYPEPEIAPDSDGEISFEWYVEPRRSLAFVTGSTEMLAYAGLFGSSKVYGREEFQGVMPEVLRMLLDRLFGFASELQ